jgi:hypothetical protein
MLRFICSLSLVLCLGPGLRGAAVPPLLQEVAEKLTDERQRWAFTQSVKEFEGDRVVEERLERFDLSRGQERRWELLKLNGRTPTREEVEAWSHRKNKVHKRPPKSATEYVDLEHARVREENGESISYEVPFRRAAGGLFPGEKVDLTLTINKKTHGIERAQVSLDESFKVAFGLAQVVDLDLDLAMPDGGQSPQPDAAADKAQGNASAVVNKFGRRIEYHWSDFVRHEAGPEPGGTKAP